MEPNGKRRKLRARLEGAQRGLRPIAGTPDRESRRVVLGCLVKDIRQIESLSSVTPLGPEEVTSLAEIQAGAVRARHFVSAPIEPADPGRSRANKGANHGTPRGRRASSVPPGSDQPAGEPIISTPP